jgi:hypothetical protein
MTRAIASFFLLSACASSPAALAPIASTRLPGSDGSAHALPAEALTVLVFFSVNCDCQAAHDRRLVDLARRYQRRGVTFYAVDSEVGRTIAEDASEARARGYPYPILLDREAVLARELGAEYATYSVVLDRAGRVLYRGGVDSDLLDLTEDTTAYLRDALDDLLAGKAPRRAYGKTLGCSLRID